MKRRDFSTALGLSTGSLALGLPGLSLAQGGPVEGRHYQRLSQPMPTAAGKIEIVEFFWYGCPHCHAFEPVLNDWIKRLPADVSFRHAHVGFRGQVKLHQRLYYALEAMGKEKELRARVFSALHVENRSLDSVKAMAAFLTPLGVDAAKFEQAYNSFGVQTKCQQADKLVDGFRIDGVPAIGIGGRFWTSPALSTGGVRVSEVESGVRALAVTDYLIQQIRSGKG